MVVPAIIKLSPLIFTRNFLTNVGLKRLDHTLSRSSVYSAPCDRMTSGVFEEREEHGIY